MTGAKVLGVSQVWLVYVGVSGAIVLGVSQVWLVYAGVTSVISFRRLQVLYRFVYYMGNVDVICIIIAPPGLLLRELPKIMKNIFTPHFPIVYTTSARSWQRIGLGTLSKPQILFFGPCFHS